MSDLKAALKEAKSAIKEKKFEVALTLCKNALKIDRKSYVALVMFGRVCQELEKYEDSKKSLLLCTQLDAEQPIAWQGLGSLHEKCPQIFQQDEALALLTKLATMTEDEEKLKNIAERKAQLCVAEKIPLAEQNTPAITDNVSLIESSPEIGSKAKVRSPSPEISREDLLLQTWNSIEVLLSNRSVPVRHEDKLEELLSSFAELTIGSQGEFESEKWLQIGLHYLAANYIEKAIRALQFAVQINPKDSMCFECLGDAYLIRGSHTVALRLYSHAITLTQTDAFYPKGQIAYIKHMTGDYFGSIMDYETLLASTLPIEVHMVTLIGLAEVLMSRAQNYLQQNLFSNIKKDCRRAIECFSLVASENPHHMTAWKRISDACALQARLPTSLSPYEVPAHLINVADSSLHFVKINKKELLLLGARCLAVALRISGKNASLWHDLGVNLFLQQWADHPSTTGQWVYKKAISHEELEKALNCIKKSLSMDANSANAWNSLGVVASFMDDFALAQHAFLKSLKTRPSAEAWSHLGALYFTLGSNDLAYESFKRAKDLDADYVACWVGQGMTEKTENRREISNIFRHSTVLGIHPESCMGHANLVMKKIADNERIADSVIQNASDCMVFYSRDKELDPVGLNTCGLLFERIGLLKSAENYFNKAIDVISKNPEIPDKLKDDIHANYGRILTTLGKSKEAIRHYSLIKEPDFYSACGAALAKMKNGDLEDAYQSYGSALGWMSPDNEQKGHVFIAMALLQYKLKRMDEVKTLLFQSCSSGNSVQALISLAAIGLLESDEHLFAATLSELEKHSDKKEYAYQISFLQATDTFKKDFRGAKLILCRALHKHPELAQLWRFLAQILLLNTCDNPADRFKSAIGAMAAASKAMTISQSFGGNANVELDVTLRALACVVAEKEYLAMTSVPRKKRKPKKKDEEKCFPAPRNSLIEAQRAVLMCPSNNNTWAVMVAALKEGKMKQNLGNAFCERTSGCLQTWFQGIAIK